MSPQILSDLRAAERGRSLLGAAGVRLELWEACCLAFSDRALLHREVARLAGNGHEPPAPDPELAERLRELRARCDPLVARLREFINPSPRGPEETERREMMLGFIAGSPAARESAERWMSDPDVHRGEAAPKLEVIGNLVERYRLALRTVVAASISGESAPSVPATAVPVAPPPMPSGLKGRHGDGRVALQWEPSPGATHYRVKRATDRNGPWETAATTPRPSFADSGLANGTTYFYRVRALNAGGRSPYSTRVRATPLAPPPPAPSGFRATPRPGRVELAWDGWPAVDRFRVKRSERPGGPYAVVGNPVAPAYVDTGVRNGTTYHYLVTSISPAGESAPSEELAVMPSPEVPAGHENVPTLEQFEAPIVGGERLAPGLDLDRLMDLRRVEQLRALFDGTGQKFEAWELAALISRDGHEVRRTLDTLLRLKSDGESDAFEAGALAIFDRILRVRAELGGLARRLRAYLEILGLPPPEPESVEIALSFVVSADRSRGRAEAWLDEPLRNRDAAAAYFRKALEIARGYLDAMRRAGEGR